jgi:hypothetical protein
MESYSYYPLANNSIRLLSLHDRTSPTFSGSLKTVNLDDAPEYFCLSYTWGSQSEDVEIRIDGYTLHVRPSLVDMLHRLQELRAENTIEDLKVEWVWIDRICINQHDLDERSQQVRCMGTIYSQAIRTIIWAGPDLDGCSSAWPLIDQIYDICMSKHPQAKYLADIPFRIYSDQNHAECELPPWDDIIWKHLRHLFTLPWFTRTWIIQEVALSSKDPIILHGKHIYPWERLGWAASWLRRNGYLRLKQIPDQLQNCDTISNIRRSRNHWRLDALLATTSVKFKSTDQRDKVYGLLGLAAETQSAEGVPNALLPDYKLSVWEVYNKVVLYFLQEYKTLPTLALASGIWGDKAREQHTHQYENLPTWVPNWSDCCVSNSEHTKGLSWLFYSTTGDATTYGFPKYSKASGDLSARVLESDDKTVLRIKGLVVDTVVGVVPYDEENQATEQYSILKAWRIYVQSLPEKKIIDCIKAFVNVSTAEQHGMSGRSEEQIHKDGAAYILQGLATNPQPEMDDDKVQEELAAISAGGHPASYFSLARNFSHNRSFVITATGCIGITPLGTQEEDTIAVIFGGGVPYVIRKHDESFLFVGESYIYGFMSGEAVQRWREGKLEEEVLEFR